MPTFVDSYENDPEDEGFTDYDDRDECDLDDYDRDEYGFETYEPCEPRILNIRMGREALDVISE